MTCSVAFGKGINRLTIVGRLDAAAVSQLMPILEAVHEPSPHTVEIELSRLQSIDEAGVRLLVGLRDWLHSAQIRVAILGLKDGFAVRGH
jgi:anti-anti-sigma regulatory factor